MGKAKQAYNCVRPHHGPMQPAVVCYAVHLLLSSLRCLVATILFYRETFRSVSVNNLTPWLFVPASASGRPFRRYGVRRAEVTGLIPINPRRGAITHCNRRFS